VLVNANKGIPIRVDIVKKLSQKVEVAVIKCRTSVHKIDCNLKGNGTIGLDRCQKLNVSVDELINGPMIDRNAATRLDYSVAQKHRILAVDDDELGLRALKRLLNKEYNILTVRSGKEALEAVPEFRPDLVLLDIMMPGIDGYEMCRVIRSGPRFDLIKIILISGRTVLEERLKGYEAGADDYITKPFNADELKAKIRIFLRLKRAEEIDRAKNDLIALFSHETRTPLTSIIGLADILKEDKRLSDDMREYHDIISKKGHELLEFVDKTALLSELKNGLTPNPTSDSPIIHINKLIISVKTKYREKNVMIHIQPDGDCELEADWSLLDKALGYILDNAVKYSPDGGEVWIKTSRAFDLFNVEVRDRGAGIDSEWIDKIFDGFAIQDIVHHHHGQGLSLAISKQVVELHNGVLRVESTRNSGTTFTVRLPLQYR
jgi:two-component system, sensor histidine kinase and response regulator